MKESEVCDDTSFFLVYALVWLKSSAQDNSFHQGEQLRLLLQQRPQQQLRRTNLMTKLVEPRPVSIRQFPLTLACQQVLRNIGGLATIEVVGFDQRFRNSTSICVYKLSVHCVVISKDCNQTKTSTWIWSTFAWLQFLPTTTQRSPIQRQLVYIKTRK